MALVVLLGAVGSYGVAVMSVDIGSEWMKIAVVSVRAYLVLVFFWSFFLFVLFLDRLLLLVATELRATYYVECMALN